MRFSGLELAPAREHCGADLVLDRVRLQLPLPLNLPRLARPRRDRAAIEQGNAELTDDRPGKLHVAARLDIEPPADRSGDAELGRQFAVGDLDLKQGRVCGAARRLDAGVLAVRQLQGLFETHGGHGIDRCRRDETGGFRSGRLPVDRLAAGKTGDGGELLRFGNRMAGLRQRKIGPGHVAECMAFGNDPGLLADKHGIVAVDILQFAVSQDVQVGGCGIHDGLLLLRAQSFACAVDQMPALADGVCGAPAIEKILRDLQSVALGRALVLAAGEIAEIRVASRLLVVAKIGDRADFREKPRLRLRQLLPGGA